MDNNEKTPRQVWEELKKYLQDKGQSPEVDRTLDTLSKVLLDGKVLEYFVKDIVKKFFGRDVPNVSGRLDSEIKIRFNNRTYILDTICRAGDILVGIDFDRSKPFNVERFFVYWSALETKRKVGQKTKNLKAKKSLMVVLTKNGIKARKAWVEVYKTDIRRNFKEEVCGTHPKGLNLMVIDLGKFNRLVPEPNKDDVLDSFLKYMSTTKLDDTILLFRDIEFWHDIIKEITDIESDFFDLPGNKDLYMIESKAVMTESDNRKNVEAELKKAKAANKAKDAKLKKAKAESKAKDAKMAEMQAEIDRLKAGKKD
jgi:hypothetical protein